MLTLTVVALVCVVMNIAGLELAAGEDLDWNREIPGDGSGKPGRRSGAEEPWQH